MAEVGVADFRAVVIEWRRFHKGEEAVTTERPFCLWLTGLSAAGKSTIADALAERLKREGVACYVLDGDRLRAGLNRDLGFADRDRSENIRRVGEVAHLLVDAGLVAIVAVISPFRTDRAAVRQLFADGRFLETFVDTPLDICQSRDPKGLYRKANTGELARFTGVSSAYEPPLAPDIYLPHDGRPAGAAVEKIIEALQQRGLLASCIASS